MCARHCVPRVHTSLRCYLPAHRVQRFLFSPPRYASTSAAHFSCHSSLRTCLPCVAARRSVSPPQTRSLPLPLAAVAYLPPPGHAGIPAVEQKASLVICAPRPQDGARPPTYGILRHCVPQNDSEHCHPERQRRIPSVSPPRSADSRRWFLTPCSCVLPVGIPSVSLCQYERCALFLPQLASGDASLHTRLRRWFLTPRSRVLPVDICCDSACAPGASRRSPTLRSAYVSLHRSFVISFLRMTSLR